MVIRTLRVRAAEGVLCCSPILHPLSPVGYIGRSHDIEGAIQAEKAGHEPPDVIEALHPAYGEPSEVPNDSYHRKLVREGDLEAADDECRVLCGLKPANVQSAGLVLTLHHEDSR